MIRRKLNSIYKKLYSSFGPQGWWPAETPFEVMVGAILTQNTAWKNVEKAIANLKKHKALKPEKMYALPEKKLAELIRPAGCYNIKARRLKAFLEFLRKNGKNRDSSIFSPVRQELLAVKGIGPESADSILLYALNQPVFVIDAYTKRILSRHKLIKESASYQEAQDLFMDNLPKKTGMFNEYHALLVKLAKDYCLKNNPRCQICPLKN